MKKLSGLLFILLCASMYAQTLEDYLKIAADNNPELKSNFLSYQSALEEVPQVGSLPDPEITFGYFVSPVETRVGAQEARFSAMQMFPWFGLLGDKRDAKSEMAKAKYELFEQSRSDLFYRVKEEYYKLYELKENTRITEEHLEILRSFESLATQKFSSGTTGLVDVLRIQMEIAELENTLLLLKDKRLPMITLFNKYLNRESGTDVLLPDSMMAIDLQFDKRALKDSILVKNYKLKGIQHNQMASRYLIEASSKMGAPSFGIGFNYVVINERTDMDVQDNGKDAFMPLLSLKLPVYKRKYRAQVKQASLNLEVFEKLEIEQRNSLQTQLEMLWVEYNDANRRILLYRNQIETAESVERILIESYSTNGKDFEEILRVQRMLLKFELEIIKAVKDINISLAKIESLM